MQTENQDKKVVSLFDRDNEAKKPKRQENDTDESYDFDSIMERNAEVKNRMKREREKANRGVVRSYRLKH